MFFFFFAFYIEKTLKAYRIRLKIVIVFPPSFTIVRPLFFVAELNTSLRSHIHECHIIIKCLFFDTFSSKKIRRTDKGLSPDKLDTNIDKVLVEYRRVLLDFKRISMSSWQLVRISQKFLLAFRELDINPDAEL